MALSTSASKANSDAGTDDPAQSILTDLAGLVDKYNTNLTHFLTSDVVKNALAIGVGLQQSGGSSAFEVKLPSGSGLQVGSTGLAIDNADATGNAIGGTKFKHADVITKSANFNVTSTDDGNAFVLNSTADRTATLPALSVGNQDKVFHFYNIGAGNLIIDGNGAETVDSNTDLTLPTNGWASILSDNTNSDNHSNVGGNLRTGLHTAVIRAGGMYAHPSGAGANNTTFDPGASVGKAALQVMSFDDVTQNQMCFGLKMPKSWDEGTLDCYVHWAATGTSTGSVRWRMEAVSVGDDDSWNVSFGTQVEATDVRIAQNDKHRSPVMTITAGGSPANDDEVVFMLTRDVADAADTLSTKALVSAVEILMGVNAGNDS